MAIIERHSKKQYNSKQYAYDYTGLRIRKICSPVHADIKNISAHTGIAITKFVKPLIKEILDEYPQHMREAKSVVCVKTHDIEIYNFSKEVTAELENVAAYIGVSAEDLIKIKLAKTAAFAPAHMKTKMVG